MRGKMNLIGILRKMYSLEQSVQRSCIRNATEQCRWIKIQASREGPLRANWEKLIYVLAPQILEALINFLAWI